MKTKKFLWLKIAIICYTTILVAIFCGNTTVALLHYNKNCETYSQQSYYGVTGDLIFDQSSANIYRYGYISMDNNGCGVIATYNILKLTNKYVPLPEIIRIYEIFGPNVVNNLGTNPVIMQWYMKSKGLDVQLHTNTSRFNEFASQSDYAIYIYVSLSGGHYQFIHDYDIETNQYTGINIGGQMSMQSMLDETQNCFVKLLMTINDNN